MPNMMESGTEYLRDTLFAQASESVTYDRAGDSVVLNAVVGSTMADTMNDLNIAIHVRSADFMVRVADLVLPIAGATKPIQGDTITRTVEGETITFEVLRTVGEKQYRESDRYGRIFRIHTKEIGRV